MTIVPAEARDLPAVRRLLDAQQLPLDDLDAHYETMVVAKNGDVGRALLRSVVVSPSAQGQGLGHRLTDAALEVARSRGLAAAFLLTTTAERFFPRLGFEPIPRRDVPDSVQASVEFQSACPASATVMRKRLG